MGKTVSDFLSPGQAIRYFLSKNGWTQEDLARILTISLKHTNELIKDKKALSLEIAMSLEKVFEWNTVDWIILDLEFQLSNKKEEDKSKLIERSAYLYEFMPINELIKKGWLKPYNNTKELDKQIRGFWNIPKEQKIDLSFLESRSGQLKYKKSDSYKKNFKEFNALIWHQKALNFSNYINIENFNKRKLYELMLKMHQYTYIKNGVSLFLKELNLSGVKFCFLSHLSKTYLDGAAFMSNNNPMVALTGRYDRVDNFWFTLAHELAHVYLHLKASNEEDIIFIDDTSTNNDKISNKEKEANIMAEKLLLKEDIFYFFKNDFGYLTEDKVLEFSNSYKLHPSIVVGLLAFNNKTSYSNLHRFKESIKDKIPKKYIVD
jgi:HTH-type transcriptional regulator/antitoxin HigA